MRPILLPLIERASRRALERRSFVTTMKATPLGRVHVYDAPGLGTLPPVVVLHGLSATSTSFAPVLARLRRHSRRVIAFDYPGHGFSEDPTSPLTPERLLETTAAVVDDLLGGDRAIVVGNSLGGVVALDYATKHAEKVEALVLLSPAGAPCSEAEWEELMGAFTITTRASALALVDRIHHRTPFILRLIAHELGANVKRRAVQELFASTTRDQGVRADHVAALAMPVLLWWGRSERLLPPSHLAWWRAHLPSHAVVEEPAGLGHCPHLDSSARVVDRIVAFATLASG